MYIYTVTSIFVYYIIFSQVAFPTRRIQGDPPLLDTARFRFHSIFIESTRARCNGEMRKVCTRRESSMEGENLSRSQRGERREKRTARASHKSVPSKKCSAHVANTRMHAASRARTLDPLAPRRTCTRVSRADEKETRRERVVRGGGRVYKEQEG